MTTKDLAGMAVPYIRNSLNHDKPNVKAQVGKAGWFFLAPAWWVVTGPLLAIITRIALEIGMGLSAAKAIPLLKGVIGFVEGVDAKFFPQTDKQFLKDLLALLQTPKQNMNYGVQMTLSGYHSNQGDCEALVNHTHNGGF